MQNTAKTHGLHRNPMVRPLVLCRTGDRARSWKKPDLGNMGKRALGGTFKGLLFKLSTVVHHNILLNRLGLGINSEFLCH